MKTDIQTRTSPTLRKQEIPKPVDVVEEISPEALVSSNNASDPKQDEMINTQIAFNAYQPETIENDAVDNNMPVTQSDLKNTSKKVL